MGSTFPARSHTIYWVECKLYTLKNTVAVSYHRTQDHIPGHLSQINENLYSHKKSCIQVFIGVLFLTTVYSATITKAPQKVNEGLPWQSSG